MVFEQVGKTMITLFGWTYAQYLYAVGALRIRPEELPEHRGHALQKIQHIWYGSNIGQGIEPPTRFHGRDIEDFFVRVAREAWDEATRYCGGQL